MKREEGFYWVKLAPEEDWQPAQYGAEVWWILGDETYYNDIEITEIGERIVKK